MKCCSLEIIETRDEGAGFATTPNLCKIIIFWPIPALHIILYFESNFIVEWDFKINFKDHHFVN